MITFTKKYPPEAVYGIIGALIYIGLTTLLYLFGLNAFLNPLFRTLLYLCILSLPIMAALHKRTLQDNNITFTEAFGAIFITFLIIETAWTFFYFMLFNYIDPGLSAQVKQAQIDYLLEQSITERNMEMEELIATYTEQDFKFTAEVAAESLLSYSFLGLILALLGGVFIKKEEKSGLGTL